MVAQRHLVTDLAQQRCSGTTTFSQVLCLHPLPASFSVSPVVSTACQQVCALRQSPSRRQGKERTREGSIRELGCSSCLSWNHDSAILWLCDRSK